MRQYFVRVIKLVNYGASEAGVAHGVENFATHLGVALVTGDEGFWALFPVLPQVHLRNVIAPTVIAVKLSPALCLLVSNVVKKFVLPAWLAIHAAVGD